MLHGCAPQLLGAADAANVIRMQLARIRPGVHIVPHVDLGGWARHSHRIHVPVVTSADVVFEVRCLERIAAVLQLAL